MGDSMKNKIYLIVAVLFVLVFCLVAVNKFADFDLFIDSFSFEEYIVNNGYKDISLYQNEIIDAKNLSDRNSKIEYIVIHYAGTTSDAEDMVNSLNRGTTINSSADFFVSLSGKIYQYNVNLKNKYSWAVGGNKLENTDGGKYYGLVSNENSISIEMSTFLKDEDWSLNSETVEATIDLVKYLIKEYDIPSKNVIRHYDVTGKLCPNVDGWLDDSVKWNDFKNSFN